MLLLLLELPQLKPAQPQPSGGFWGEVRHSLPSLPGLPDWLVKLLSGGGNVNEGIPGGLSGLGGKPVSPTNPFAAPSAPSPTAAPAPAPRAPRGGPSSFTVPPPPYGPVSPQADLDRKRAEAEAAIVATPSEGSLSTLDLPSQRFQHLAAPSLSRQAPGQRPDFSTREAELLKTVEPPKGFGENFFRAFSPSYGETQKTAEARKIALSEQMLRQEKEEADADFRRQEDMKDKVYLSELASRIGKTYGADTSTGLSGFFAPAEVSSMQLAQDKMDLERQQIDLARQAQEQMSPYRQALTEEAQARARYTGDLRGQMSADNQRRLALTAILQEEMNPFDPGQSERKAAAAAALAQMSGIGGGPSPFGGAAPAPPGPLEQKAVELGLPPEIAKGLDRLDTPAKKAAAFEKLKKDPKYNTYTTVLGSLLGVQ